MLKVEADCKSGWINLGMDGSFETICRDTILTLKGIAISMDKENKTKGEMFRVVIRGMIDDIMNTDEDKAQIIDKKKLQEAMEWERSEEEERTER